MPPDSRLSWRMPVLLLSVKAVRGGKATFKQIALLAHALNTVDARDMLVDYLDGRLSLYEVPIRFEPGLPYLIQVAVQRGLLEFTKNERYIVTQAGLKTLDEVNFLGSIRA